MNALCHRGTNNYICAMARWRSGYAKAVHGLPAWFESRSGLHLVLPLFGPPEFAGRMSGATNILCPGATNVSWHTSSRRLRNCADLDVTATAMRGCDAIQ